MSETLPAVVSDAELVEKAEKAAKKAIAARGGMWKPGQSGNPTGRPKGSKNHLVELQRQLEIAVRDNLNPSVVKGILEKMAMKALAGDVKAAKLILDKVLSNAQSGGEEDSDKGGQFIFQVKNLTLKHDPTPDTTVRVINVTPQEIQVSTGASQSNQHRDTQAQGGNVVGKAPNATLHQPPAFQGKSGQSDNQDTSRPAGRT